MELFALSSRLEGGVIVADSMRRLFLNLTDSSKEGVTTTESSAARFPLPDRTAKDLPAIVESTRTQVEGAVRSKAAKSGGCFRPFSSYKPQQSQCRSIIGVRMKFLLTIVPHNQINVVDVWASMCNVNLESVGTFQTSLCHCSARNFH